MNPFEYSIDNKRYHTLNYYNKQHFNNKMYKAIINLGCSCPNIDSLKGGCIYCSNKSEYFSPSSLLPVDIQLKKEIERIHFKHPSAQIIAYFQSGTNTYGNFNHLIDCYETVLLNPYVKGISIGTRADCLEDYKLDYFLSLAKKTHLTIELGLQTTNDNTAKLINRGHSFLDFKNTYYKLKKLNIRTCIHLINSLPFESQKDMIKTAIDVGKLYPDAIKIHMLHINKNTPIEQMYKKNEFQLLSKDEYVTTVVKQLEYIPKTTVIERLTGDGDKSTLVAPDWSKDKLSVLVAIDKTQVKLNSFQGKNII